MSRWIGKIVQFSHVNDSMSNRSRYRGELLWLGVTSIDQGPDRLCAVLMDSNGRMKKENVESMILCEVTDDP